MSIVTATWADLGYRKLGPSSRLNASKTKLVAEVMDKYRFHEIQSANDERWVRDRARVKGVPTPWFIRRVASITKDVASESHGTYTCP